MGVAFRIAISKDPVNENIVSFLDNWSTASTCASDASDIANIADADLDSMSTPYGLHVHVLEQSLYTDSIQYPNGIRIRRR